MRRVVITGMGLISPVGNRPQDAWETLVQGKTGIVSMPQWEDIRDLKVGIAGACKAYIPKKIPRRDRRTMGNMAVMAALSVQDALAQAGLESTAVQTRRCGVAMGSTTGSGPVLEEMFRDFMEVQGMGRLEGTTFMKVMNHSIAANVAAMLGCQGRVMAPCAACATSTQAIGQGYEFIRDGAQEIMICGGADELHPSTAGVFDVIRAASQVRDPQAVPGSFDARRQGLVVGEGAGALILEEYHHAKKRKAPILGEIIGFQTGCDGAHMTSPQAEGMEYCMASALESAGLSIRDMDYINAHATGTPMGDMAEAAAIAGLGSHPVPVSATKGYTGHTLAASGVMETIFCLLMMENDLIIPTRNLETIDPQCDAICHVTTLEKKKLHRVMTSNFAFGGINTTLILEK